MFVLVAYIEELGLAQSVVCGNEVADDLGQSFFVCHPQSFGDMADDDLCTLYVRQHLVRVDARLVLGIVYGVGQFADVVVEGTCTHQLSLGTNLVGYLARQVGHLDGVVEGAWGYLAHATQQRTVGVGEFDECDVAGKSEGFLDEIKQRIGEKQGNAVEYQIVVYAIVNLAESGGLGPVEGEIDNDTGQGDDEGCPEEL